MAKKNLHPKLYNTKIYYQGEVILELLTPVKEISVDVWSETHPFYTNSQKILDITGRVEKFEKKYKNN